MEGVEFLHRLPWRHSLRHEFRLMRWADPVGSKVMERSRDRFRLVGALSGTADLAEAAIETFRQRMALSHKSRGREPFGFWRISTVRSY